MSGTVGEFFGGSGRRIRDEIWGDVSVDRTVRALLRTRAVQRLKEMRQLGLSSQAFPGARHSRFDHAIGVYHLTRLTLKHITDSGAYLEDGDVQSALAAALLLDVGSYPHAQAIENISLPGMVARKELNRRWIEQSEVAKVLRNDWDIEPHNVYRLVTRGRDLPIALTPTEHLIRDILFGPLDVDMLDSLLRDARATGVPYCLVSAEPLIESLRIVGQDNRAVLTVDENGIGFLQALIFSRYLMHYNVYGHHALRVQTVMFLRAVQDAIQDGAVTPDKLSELGDDEAFALVRDSAPENTSSAILARRLAERRPYRRALQIDERHSSYAALMRLRDDAAWRRRVEEAWSRYLTRYRKGDAGPFDILIDIPEKRDFSVDLRFIRRAPLPGERNLSAWEDLSAMSREDTRRYHIPLHRISIFASRDDLTRAVRRHAEELFTIAEEIG